MYGKQHDDTLGLIQMYLNCVFKLIDVYYSKNENTKITIEVSSMELNGKFEENCIDLLLLPLDESDENSFKSKNSHCEKSQNNNTPLLNSLTQLVVESEQKAVHYLDLALSKRSCKSYKYQSK